MSAALSLPLALSLLLVPYISWPALSRTADPIVIPTVSTRYVTVGTLTRRYLVYAPPGLTSDNSVPVILAFHGGFATPESLATVTNLNIKGPQLGFVVVFPEGYVRSWNAGSCCGQSNRQNVDDVAFVRALLDDLRGLAKVDDARVFATGMSNGGMFAYRLACEMSDQIAAIAPVSSVSTLPNTSCSPGRPVPVLDFQGLADQYVPIGGGASAAGPAAGTLPAVADVIDFWVQTDHASAQGQVTFQSGAASCITHSPESAGTEVTLCTIAGMGHQWPGGTPVNPATLGPGNNDISASDTMLEFFRDHPIT